MVDDLDGVGRVGLEDALLPVVGDPELGRRQEPRAHADALGAERQRGRQAAAVGDAAGGATTGMSPATSTTCGTSTIVPTSPE